MPKVTEAACGPQAGAALAYGSSPMRDGLGGDMFSWEARGTALKRLGRLDLAIPWRGAGFQGLEEPFGDCRDIIYRGHECCFIRLGRFVESADLSHKLQGGSANFDFCNGGVKLKRGLMLRHMTDSSMLLLPYEPKLPSAQCGVRSPRTRDIRVERRVRRHS